MQAMQNLNIETIKSKINLEKFLFVKKEENLHTRAFNGRLTLKTGVLICSIASLILSTAMVLHAVEVYSFLFFLAYFLPNLANAAGAVLMLLSIDTLDKNKASLGCIITAAAAWLHAGLIALSLVFTLLWSPKYFFTNIIGTVFLIALVVLVTGYAAWIDYCYAKHLHLGNVDVVCTGRAEGLISKEEGPGISGPADINRNAGFDPKPNDAISRQI